MAEQVNNIKPHKNLLKIIINVTIFLVVTCLALFYVLKDDPGAIFNTLAQVNFFPFLLAIGCFIFIDVFEGLSITLLARLFDKKYRFTQGWINTIIGNFIGCFYKTGASFLQAYTFTKQGIKGTNAASICTMNFLVYQLVVTLFSLIMVFVGYPYVKDIPIELLGNIKIFPLSLIGLGINIFFLVFIILMAYCKGLHRIVITAGVAVGSKLHIIKDKEATRKKWAIQLATYRIELKRLMTHRYLLFVLCLLQAMKLLLLNSIPYFCFLSLNIDISQISYISTLSGSVYLNLISTYLIFGAPEIGFQSIFSYILSSLGGQASTIASAGNILWRTLTFYLSLIIGGICFLFYRGSPRKHKLLSSTATIYDLQVLNVEENADSSIKEYLASISPTPNMKASLLSKEEVNLSFKRIKESMEQDDEEEIELLSLSQEDLDKQKETLTNIINEMEELMKEQAQDYKIEEEAINEIKSLVEQKNKKEEEKNLRKDLKMQKKAQKYRDKIVKKNPDGTTVTYDEERGLIIESPEIYESRTLPTSSDDDEAIDDQEDEDDRRDLH